MNLPQLHRRASRRPRPFFAFLPAALGEELMLQRSEGKQYLVIPADDVLADIPPEYILEPDEDLERAISFDEFRAGALAHIEALYRREQ